MKSIPRITIIHQVCWGSRNRRIPPLPNMEWSRNIIRSIDSARMKIFVRSNLNKCFSPIKQNGYNYHIKTIFPIQRPFHKGGETYTQIYQSKEVTPDKFGGVLNTFHIALINRHGSFSNLHPHNTTIFIKNVIINTPKISNLLLKEGFFDTILQPKGKGD